MNAYPWWGDRLPGKGLDDFSLNPLSITTRRARLVAYPKRVPQEHPMNRKPNY